MLLSCGFIICSGFSLFLNRFLSDLWWLNGWLGHLLSQGMAATVFGNGCIFVSERLAGPCQRLAASVLWICWLGQRPCQQLAARSVVGYNPHYQTTALCAALLSTLTCWQFDTTHSKSLAPKSALKPLSMVACMIFGIVGVVVFDINIISLNTHG